MIARIGLAAGAVAALGGAVWLYGQQQHRRGVVDATRDFVEADRKGADDVTETAEKILRDIGSVDDPIGLLRETGGLRAD